MEEYFVWAFVVGTLAVNLITKRFVLGCVDFYLDTMACLKRFYMGFQFRSLKKTIDSNPIAYSGDQNINTTEIVRAYYAGNELHSCGNLMVWLRNCNLAVNPLTIIHRRDTSLYCSVIDLENEFVLNADEDLLFGDISLKSLPARVVW